MKLKKVLMSIAALAVIGTVGTYNVVLKETVDFTVTRSEFNVNGDYSRYLVWADRGDQVEIFKNTNSVLALKFNSQEIFESISVGDNCVAKVTGFRMPFLVIYRNILSINCKEA